MARALTMIIYAECNSRHGTSLQNTTGYSEKKAIVAGNAYGGAWACDCVPYIV